MRTITVSLGIATALIVTYLCAAFVKADVYWVETIWEWSAVERAGLLFSAMVAASFGAAIGIVMHMIANDDL